MIPEKFLKMFAGYTSCWRTCFDYKITDITLYATYSDGHQEKFSYPLGIDTDVIVVTHQVFGQPLKVAKKVNVNVECNEWFSCREGYGLFSYPELQQKIVGLYSDVVSKDASADVFFTFEPSIKLDEIKPGDLLPNFPLGGFF